MAGYNGYKNWNQWNVALWLHNDEGLYRTMCIIRRHYSRVGDAAAAMLALLNRGGTTETPDGARYSVTAIRTAMRELN